MKNTKDRLGLFASVRRWLSRLIYPKDADDLEEEKRRVIGLRKLLEGAEMEIAGVNRELDSCKDLMEFVTKPAEELKQLNFHMKRLRHCIDMDIISVPDRKPMLTAVMPPDALEYRPGCVLRNVNATQVRIDQETIQCGLTMGLGVVIAGLPPNFLREAMRALAFTAASHAVDNFSVKPLYKG